MVSSTFSPVVMSIISNVQHIVLFDISICSNVNVSVSARDLRVVTNLSIDIKAIDVQLRMHACPPFKISPMLLMHMFVSY